MRARPSAVVTSAAIARPIPRVPPVTRAVLPARVQAGFVTRASSMTHTMRSSMRGWVSMIRMLSDTDFPALFGHMCRHGDESGRNGDVIFRPRSQHEVMDEVQISQRHRQAWARPLDQPLWMRTWGVFIDNALVGH